MDYIHRISTDPEILGGKPVIKGTRISVEFILELYASGATREDIIRGYPHLTEEDIYAALFYASRFLKNEIVIEMDTLQE